MITTMNNRPSPSVPHRKLCKRYNTAGHAHFLTFSCFRRQPFLDKDRCRLWLAEAVERARQLHAFHVWAYVVMPEHAHLLLWPTKVEYDISAILNSIKQSVSKKALLYVRRQAPAFLEMMANRQPSGIVHHRFWQRGGGYDRNVVEPQETFRQIEYIHNNPVRRGLCAVAEEWPWSSAGDYAGVRQGPVWIDRTFLPVFRAER
jgi:putative transposase